MELLIVLKVLHPIFPRHNTALLDKAGVKGDIYNVGVSVYRACFVEGFNE